MAEPQAPSTTLVDALGAEGTPTEDSALFMFMFERRLELGSFEDRIVHGESSAKHELGERLKALYKQAQRNLELLIPSGTNR